MSGIRFNESLYDTLNNWEQTKAVFGSSTRYREILTKTWDLASRQTAHLDTAIGAQVRNFSVNYTPISAAAFLFGHDPVLPYGELYQYSFYGLKVGYAHRLWDEGALGPFDLGLAVQMYRGEAQKYVLNLVNNQFEQKSSATTTWSTARIGTTVWPPSVRRFSFSLVLSGIPILNQAPGSLTNADILDLQPGLTYDLGSLGHVQFKSYYSLSRLFLSEDILLKQHLGLSAQMGKFVMGVGVNDAQLSYGISLNLPILTVQIASYGIEYSGVARNITDRVYWVTVAI